MVIVSSVICFTYSSFIAFSFWDISLYPFSVRFCLIPQGYGGLTCAGRDDLAGDYGWDLFGEVGGWMSHKLHLDSTCICTRQASFLEGRFLIYSLFRGLSSSFSSCLVDWLFIIIEPANPHFCSSASCFRSVTTCLRPATTCFHPSGVYFLCEGRFLPITTS